MSLLWGLCRFTLSSFTTPFSLFPIIDALPYVWKSFSHIHSRFVYSPSRDCPPHSVLFPVFPPLKMKLNTPLLLLRWHSSLISLSSSFSCIFMSSAICRVREITDIGARFFKECGICMPVIHCVTLGIAHTWVRLFWFSFVKWGWW